MEFTTFGQQPLPPKKGENSVKLPRQYEWFDEYDRKTSKACKFLQEKYKLYILNGRTSLIIINLYTFVYRIYSIFVNYRQQLNIIIPKAFSLLMLWKVTLAHLVTSYTNLDNCYKDTKPKLAMTVVNFMLIQVKYKQRLHVEASSKMYTPL